MFAHDGDDGGGDLLSVGFLPLVIFRFAQDFRLSQKVTQRLCIIRPLRGLLFVCKKIRIFSCKSLAFG